MIVLIQDFFGLVGLSPIPPQTMAELIPYLLHVFVGLALVTAVFRVVATIVSSLFVLLRRL